MMVKKHAKSALLIAVCLCAGILNNGIVYALDYTFYTSNGILYYDPDAPTCNDTTTPTGSNVEIVSNENAEAILTVLTKQGGFSLAASAGIVGNLMMLRLMREGGMGLAVSLSAVTQLLVINVIAFLVFGERLSGTQLAGVALGVVSMGLMLLPSPARS